MLFDDYTRIDADHRKKYGPKTLVLMEVGSFYELYSDGDKVLPCIREVCDLLNIVLTRKNKGIVEVSRTNPMMAGFPSLALSKYVPVLLEASFTIVMVEQTTPPPNPIRKVTRILSRSTCPEEDRRGLGQESGNGLMSVYYDCADEKVAFVGIAVLDLATGKSKSGEFYSTSMDKERALDEAYRMITIHRPSEIVLLSPIESNIGSYLQKRLELDTIPSFDRTGKEFDKQLRDTTYQEALFAKAHGIDKQSSLLRPLEILNMERAPWCAIAYAGLLQFAHQHDETIVKRLELPKPLDVTDTALVCFNTLKQLGVTGSPGQKTLLSVLNRCSTAPGRREFKDRLLSPSSSPLVMRTRYQAVKNALDSHQEIRKSLRGVPDLQRLWRKVVTNSVRPPDILAICHTVHVLDKLCKDDCILESVINKQQSKNALKSMINCFSVIDPDGHHGFCRGVHVELDELADRHCSAMERLQEIAQMVNGKVEERDGSVMVTTTQKRFKDALAHNPNRTVIEGLELGETSLVSVVGGFLKIHHPLFEEHTRKTDKIKQALHNLGEKLFSSFVLKLQENYDADMNEVTRCLVDLDVHSTCAWNANEFRYTEPIIVDDSTNDSWVDGNDIRHPVIERVQDHVKYVTNDLTLGTKENKTVLLYGLNAAGKTSLAKAIALNVIMAQAGMFVASTCFRLCPYTQIMSRITTGDDIVNGLSTFTVEMMELRNVLLRADRHSLVVADELCAGTEHRSGVAIVAAGIETLTKRGASFIMATHLHELPDIPELQNANGIAVFHLKVRVDTDTGRLVYERKLQEGRGPDTYGVEVCRGLHLPPEFVLSAQRIRHRLMGIENDLVSKSRSRYNKKVILDTCEICKEAKAVEVHHIEHQAKADDRGYLKHYHKNVRHNLIALCEACHDACHSQ
jgi:DNA mismatch repair protein MutS